MNTRDTRHQTTKQPPLNSANHTEPPTSSRTEGLVTQVSTIILSNRALKRRRRKSDSPSSRNPTNCNSINSQSTSTNSGEFAGRSLSYTSPKQPINPSFSSTSPRKFISPRSSSTSPREPISSHSSSTSPREELISPRSSSTSPREPIDSHSSSTSPREGSLVSDSDNNKNSTDSPQSSLSAPQLNTTSFSSLNSSNHLFRRERNRDLKIDDPMKRNLKIDYSTFDLPISSQMANLLLTTGIRHYKNTITTQSGLHLFFNANGEIVSDDTVISDDTVKQEYHEVIILRTKPDIYESYLIDRNCMLGTGAQGEVFLGHHLMKKLKVAIKILYTKLYPAHEEIEINKLKKMERYMGSCLTSTANKRTIFIMPYAPGQNLITYLYSIDPKKKKDESNYIIGKRYIKPSERIQILKLLAQTVDHFHNKGNMIHRDIKTENFIIKDDNMTLIDLDNAIFTNEKSKSLSSSLGYTPPEICSEKGRREYYSKKSDLWSLGVVMGEVISGFSYQNQIIKTSQKNILHQYLEQISCEELQKSMPDIFSDPFLYEELASDGSLKNWVQLPPDALYAKLEYYFTDLIDSDRDYLKQNHMLLVDELVYYIYVHPTICQLIMSLTKSNSQHRLENITLQEVAKELMHLSEMYLKWSTKYRKLYRAAINFNIEELTINTHLPRAVREEINIMPLLLSTQPTDRSDSVTLKYS
ncbi:MAG: protein kinase [Gammaproteobacteria bacterium]|nr:protein kinase [Gammaproteobacteria bacterium]